MDDNENSLWACAVVARQKLNLPVFPKHVLTVARDETRSHPFDFCEAGRCRFTLWQQGRFHWLQQINKCKTYKNVCRRTPGNSSTTTVLNITTCTQSSFHARDDSRQEMTGNVSDAMCWSRLYSGEPLLTCLTASAPSLNNSLKQSRGNMRKHSCFDCCTATTCAVL